MAAGFTPLRPFIDNHFLFDRLHGFSTTEFEGLSGKGDNQPQKVKGQWRILIVKQFIMVEVQQLTLCTVEIQPCYLPWQENFLLTFDLFGFAHIKDIKWMSNRHHDHSDECDANKRVCIVHSIQKNNPTMANNGAVIILTSCLSTSFMKNIWLCINT